VEEEDVFQLHGDLPPAAINAAKRYRTKPRIVLSSSLGEMAVTIPDVDAVLNSGISRFVSDDDEIPLKLDYLASVVTNKQREGRGGCTKAGCLLKHFFLTNGPRPDVDVPMSANELMHDIAFEAFHEMLPATSCSSLSLQMMNWTLHGSELTSVDSKGGCGLFDALTKVPLPLHLSAIVDKGIR
jgi:HrpA-like RNA helicase